MARCQWLGVTGEVRKISKRVAGGRRLSNSEACFWRDREDFVQNLEAYLDAYIEAAKIRDGGKAPCSGPAAGTTDRKADEPRRCLAHGSARRPPIPARPDRLAHLPRHGITAYLEAAPGRTRQPAARESLRTTKLMIGLETRLPLMRSRGSRFECAPPRFSVLATTYFLIFALLLVRLGLGDAPPVKARRLFSISAPSARISSIEINPDL
jgi:hypothetical protein